MNKQDTLRTIMSGESDFPSPDFERNYHALKEMIIKQKQEYSQTWNVDTVEAHYLAWRLAERHDHIRLNAPKPPRFSTAAIVVGVSLFYIILYTVLALL